jgi:hypothetical protein
MSGPIRLKSKISEIPRLFSLYGLKKFVYMVLFEIKCKIFFNHTENFEVVDEPFRQNQVQVHYINDIEMGHVKLINDLSGSDFINNVGVPNASSNIFRVYQLTMAKLVGVDALPTIGQKYFIQHFENEEQAIARIRYNQSGSPFYISTRHIRNKKMLNGNYLRLINRKYNYFHYLTEQVVKIYYVSKITDDFKIIVDPPYYQYHRDIHDLIDYDIVEHTDGLRVQNLFEIDFPLLEPRGLEFIRSYFTSRLTEVSQSPTHDLVFCKRFGRRKIMNADEIISKLSELGLDVIRVDFAELNLAQQIKLMQNTKGLIGAHGAGLTNMIWAENLHVYELFGARRKAVYKGMSRMLGHVYSPIFGISTGDGNINDDIYIDFEDIVRTLNL